MPKQASELAAYQIKRLNEPGLHAIGGVAGLYLRIKDTGARSWALRVVVGDRRREIGLGGAPTVTLEMARQKARDARLLIEAGTDPVAAKKAARDSLRAAEAKRLTFAEAAKIFLRSKTAEFNNAKHAAQWTATLKTYAEPVLGLLQVDQIEHAHIVKVLEPVWQEKPETASRVRGRIEAVLSWATVSGYRSGPNPARWKGNLDQVLPKLSRVRVVEHHAALPWQEIGSFMAELRKAKGTAARALELLILTAARSGEIRLATWDEIDLKSKLWVVPASRMKAKKKHTVPLSDPAVKLLKALPRHKGSSYVFTAPRGGALSDMALTAVMRRLHAAGVPHGMRSAFKDWARSSTAYADEVSELALAHVNDDKTRSAYARDELLPKRTKLMAEWARYVGTVPTRASVTHIRKTR